MQSDTPSEELTAIVRAAHGDLEAQRGIVVEALQLGQARTVNWADALSWAEIFARLAAHHGQNSDAHVLASVLAIRTHDAETRGDTSAATAYRSEGIAIVAALADLGDEGAAESFNQIGAEVDPCDLVRAKLYHTFWGLTPGKPAPSLASFSQMLAAVPNRTAPTTPFEIGMIADPLASPCWENAKAMLLRDLGYSADEWAQIERDLAADNTRLWAVNAGDLLTGVAITRIVLTGEGEVAEIACIGGVNHLDWIGPLSEVISGSAREIGCVALRAVGFDAWRGAMAGIGWGVRTVEYERRL